MSIPAIDTADFLIDIQSKFNNKGTEQAIQSIRGVRSEIGTFIKNADLGESAIKKFANSFMRIAKVRMIRSAIRGVSNAIKEGTENIYQYSQALQNADASRFASTMDSLASAMLYMKNSVGAVVAPLLTALLPAIQKVVSWFVTATNVIAQFFAVLGGQTTYTRAKQQATVWKDVGSSIGGATAAAKEYQNTILSFDEIHALNDTPSSGGGGGGGGASAPDYSDMFEEAEIADTWLNRIAKTLKDNFNDVLDIAKAIGAVLLGWKIAQKVTDFFSNLGFGGGKNALSAMVGITMMITGFTLETKGAFDIGYSGADLGNMIKTAIGASLGIAGTAITFGALGLGATAGLGIGIIASLTILLAGVKIGEMEKYLDSTIRATENYKELVRIIEHADSVQGTYISHATDLYNQTLLLEGATGSYAASANLAYGESLIARIKELASKTNLTVGETAELEAKCRILNELGLDGIQVEFDTTTKKVTANWKEIDKNIEKMKELAKTEASFELLKEAYEEQFRLEIEHERLLSDNEEATQAYTKAQEDFARVQQNSADGTIHYDRETKAARETMLKAKQAVDDTSKALGECDEAMKINSKTIGILTGDYNSTKTSANNATGAVNNFRTAVTNTNSMNPTFQGIQNGINATANTAYNAWYWVTSLNNMVSTLRNAATTGINIAVNVLKNLGYANGGFVTGYANGGIIPRFDGGGINSAQLFMANENGNAELIGSIGNRTAVANQGQMVEAMAEGVYRAMSDVMSQGSNTEVNVYMNDEIVARAADRGNRLLNRRFNVSLA